jgi:hypothetical protein
MKWRGGGCAWRGRKSLVSCFWCVGQALVPAATTIAPCIIGRKHTPDQLSDPQKSQTRADSNPAYPLIHHTIAVLPFHLPSV